MPNDLDEIDDSNTPTIVKVFIVLIFIIGVSIYMSDQQKRKPPNVFQEFTLPNGQRVMCIVEPGRYTPSECDWEHAH